MPSRDTHIIAGAISGVLLAHRAQDDDEKVASGPFLVGAVAGAAGGRLPDILEPAVHPNHRQFCHSWLVLGLLGVGLYKVAKWSPEAGWEKCLRYLALGLIGGYACHLVFDCATPKGLPLVGKI